MMLDRILARGEAGDGLSARELTQLLNLEDPAEQQALFDAAYRVKLRHVGPWVRLRGLIEMSNFCVRDCYYCGIRKSNRRINRFELSFDEILAAAKNALGFGYGSIVLQSGERSDPAFVEFVESVTAAICALPGCAGITLSCGEQTMETYRRWRRAGAERYLLRIESSNPRIFRSIHPADASFDDRVAALHRLRECDYQVGTGVMIGLPGQSGADLADDIEFFHRLDIDMIGMGPWLPHHDAPLRDVEPETPERARKRFELGLRMIASTRLQLQDVNIASTTALQALDPRGRELGLRAGANVIMPNAGGIEHRADYTLYDNKPGLDENAAETRLALERSIAEIGEKIAYDVAGTSPHYLKRQSGQEKQPSPEPRIGD